MYGGYVEVDGLQFFFSIISWQDFKLNYVIIRGRPVKVYISIRIGDYVAMN